MATLIYANANSLFDYSNGAARSIKLLLEAVASSGTHVRAITSCASDSQRPLFTARAYGLQSGNGPLGSIHSFNGSIRMGDAARPFARLPT